MTTQNGPGDPVSWQRKAPLNAAPFAGGSGSPSSASSYGDSQHLLVVDDEASIRLSLHRFLTRLGYRVSVARNGREALAILSEHQQVDLVITDLVMPDYDGRELILTMRSRHPNVLVLVISGFPASLLPDPEPGGQPLPYLAKPFALDALAAEVQRLLDQRRERRATE
ncbi:MAG: response regulator [Gemmatimonadaceae bacterium]